MPIVFNQGDKHTNNHRQLISSAGLSLTEYSSESNIQGKPRVSKPGSKNSRDVLYICSMNAMETGVACKAPYYRLHAKEQTGKQTLIAVCHKLLKQVFAVGKNNSLYQPNYCWVRPRKSWDFTFFCTVHPW
jgi:transposase